MTATKKNLQCSIGKTTKTMMWILTAAGLSMGNEGCDEAQKKSRVLRMDVEVGLLNARPVTLPTGEVIDFPYAVNTLFYRQVMNNDHFVILGKVPTPSSMIASPTHSGGDFALKAASTGNDEPVLGDDDGTVSDSEVLDRYGFLDRLRAKAAAQLQRDPLDGGSFDGARKSVTAQSSPIADEDLPACLYDMPSANLGGEMISFEASWGAGVGVGYGPNGAPVPGHIGGYVNFNSSKLEIGLRSDDPLTQNTLVIADGVAHQQKVGFGIDFGTGLPIGLDFIFNTPLSDVIRQAMDKGLSKVVAKYKDLKSPNKKSWDDVWESRIVYDPEIVNNDTHVVFRGGYRAGVQVGDTFTVTNLHYKWAGAPCYTPLKYAVALTATPLAELTVIDNGDNISVAQVTTYHFDDRIRPGARVKVLKLYEPQPIPAPTD